MRVLLFDGPKHGEDWEVQSLHDILGMVHVPELPAGDWSIEPEDVTAKFIEIRKTSYRYAHSLVVRLKGGLVLVSPVYHYYDEHDMRTEGLVVD